MSKAFAHAHDGHRLGRRNIVAGPWGSLRGMYLGDSGQLSHLIKEGLGKKNESSAHALYYGRYVSTMVRPASGRPHYVGPARAGLEVYYQPRLHLGRVGRWPLYPARSAGLAGFAVDGKGVGVYGRALRARRRGHPRHPRPAQGRNGRLRPSRHGDALYPAGCSLG